MNHTATVSKPGWKDGEERAEVPKAACLPRAAAFDPRPLGSAELSIPLTFSCAQGLPGLWAPKHSWSHPVFLKNLFRQHSAANPTN